MTDQTVTPKYKSIPRFLLLCGLVVQIIQLFRNTYISIPATLLFATAFYLELLWKGYRPIKKVDYYLLVFATVIFPVIGFIAALHKLTVTPVAGQPLEQKQRRRSWWLIIVFVLFAGIIIWVAAIQPFMATKKRYQLNGRITSAWNHYEAAIALRDQPDKARFNDEIAKAIGNLDKVMEQNPAESQKIKALRLYGDLYALQGKNDLAEKYYYELLALIPNDPETFKKIDTLKRSQQPKKK